MKTLIKPMILSLLITAYGCKTEDSYKEKILEDNSYGIKYLSEYIEDYQVGCKVNIDSFNILFRKIKVFNPDDSSLIYLNLFKDKCLLFIKKDSIEIYKRGGFTNSMFGIVSDVSELIENNQRDSAIKLVMNSGKIIYSFKLDTSYVNLISYNSEFKDCYFLYLYNDEILHWAFSYNKTIFNNIIDINNIEFTNSWPYDIDSLRFYQEP